MVRFWRLRCSPPGFRRRSRTPPASSCPAPPRPGRELAVRTGIATGRVRVGDLIGEGASQESAAVGETLNLAVRIQGESEANTVTISDATHPLVAGLFE